jgi:hypothetical protein
VPYRDIFMDPDVLAEINRTRVSAPRLTRSVPYYGPKDLWYDARAKKAKTVPPKPLMDASSEDLDADRNEVAEDLVADVEPATDSEAAAE